MAPSGGGGGLQAERICFFVFLLGHQATQALEVMEQCRVENRRTGEKAMANIKGTLVYTKQIQTLKADFWKEGVGGSKKLLKKILKKITNYEEQHVNLDEQVNKKLGKRFKRLGKEDVWYDQAEHRPVYKDEFCAAVDDLKTRERTTNEDIKEINYDCPETEQLYGIGYHKFGNELTIQPELLFHESFLPQDPLVYEQCKDDPFLAKFDVDFSVCLHAHYPWVDMLNWGVCVMKQYNSNFLACFCSTKGLTKPRQMLVVKDTCMAAIEYFTEPGITEDEWLSEKQQLDKLRVRAPYHMESPCFEKSFSSNFDVGQFKQDLASTSVKIPSGLQVEVFTPKLDGYRVIEMEDQVGRRNGKPGGMCRIPEKPEPRVEQPTCGAKPKPPPEEPVNPQVQKKKEDLIEIYTERMVTTSVPWIPGIFFLYSYLLSERSRKQKLFVNAVQFGVIILGTYNSIVSTVLWKSSLYTLPGGIGRNEVIALGAAFAFACCINYKEIGELFLILSLLHFASNILLLFLVPHIRTEENVMTCTFISYSISVTLTAMLLFLVWRQVDKLDKKREKEVRWKQEMVDMIASGKSREGDRRKPGKVKPGQQKRPQPSTQRDDPKDFNQVFNEIEGEVRERSRIQCGWKNCKEESNMGYLSVSCTQTNCPVRHYHSACWKLLLFTMEIRDERGLLGASCLLDTCSGKVSRLSWFTGLGREITNRRLVWDPPKQVRKTNQVKKGEGLPSQRKPETRKVLSVAPRIREPDPKVQLDLLDYEKPKIKSESSLLPDEETDLNYITKTDCDDDIELQRVAPFPQISNMFGTIGSERRAKNSVTAPESPSTLSSTSSPIPQRESSFALLDNFMIGEDDWDIDLPQALPTSGPRSKILSMIEKNQQPITKDIQLQSEERSGFLVKMDFEGRTSSSLSYIPDSKTVGGEDVGQAGNSFDFSVNYISSQDDAGGLFEEQTGGLFEEQSWLVEGYDSDSELYNQLEEDPEEIESKEEKPVSKEFDNVPPLTRILRKSLSGYCAAQIDLAMASVMESVDCQTITIPEFQALVQSQLEFQALVQSQLETRSPVVSDQEECHMCLEPLYGGPEVEALNPCKHVFHAPCIRPWLQKDPSCPKCRAEIKG